MVDSVDSIDVFKVNILKTLLDSMASPALRNENGPKWTPLHAAALQEEGKACMLLLERRANPLEKDVEGILASEYLVMPFLL